MPGAALSRPIARRRVGEALVERLSLTSLSLAGAAFEAIVYRDLLDGGEHLALTRGDPGADAAPLVRVRCECLIGDLFGGERCGCRARLEQALAEVAAAEAGVLVYVRGPGTVAAGLASGHCGEGCDEEIAARILADLEVAPVPDLAVV